MSPPRMTEEDIASLPLVRSHVAKIRRALVDDMEIDRLALKLLGVLSDASNQETRRRALEKARRMLGTR